MNTFYLDHAATTPMREVAAAAWMENAQALNPASQYGSGRKARSVADSAREEIASLLGCEPIEVVFTASGTEADNLAVQGLFHASPLNWIISTPIEHPGILETVKALELGGAEAELMPIGPDGRVSSFEALDKPAAVATMMWANNETGAIQPVSEFIAAAQASGTPTHIDAVQVVGHLPVNFDELGATTLAASAHKFGGPRGVGLLLARRSPAPSAVLHGGGQERGIRPGTLDVAGASATAAALREAVAELDGEATRLRGLKKMLLDAILHTIPNVLVHTTEPSLPGHLHLSFPGAEGDSLIMLLDSLRIEASTGSACSNGVNRASHVLLAMGISETDARGAIRFTLGRTTTEESIKAVIAVIEDVVTRARTAGMAF
ncbi:cysteine desulfurase [Corynebacterium glutamicum ZL-6]|uniref:cysteine desulfurase family protein n=1 Tax=Corynebacterium TaxID=1716 RepID=UPI00080743F9|nr:MULTISPECIES: cysteine desulfurase family protein [Corynebacterium]ANR62294.1 cysteine desulfurase [[Brevibacterium] flavum ZL-1]ANR65298.1 cysteine desulfurase [Corynebacterium glutamicum ZL-6]PST76256.1 cysteine desulfurase [Corynebacterium glutamicum ZL-2]